MNIYSHKFVGLHVLQADFLDSAERSPMGMALWAGHTEIVKTLHREHNFCLNEKGSTPVFFPILKKKTLLHPISRRKGWCSS